MTDLKAAEDVLFIVPDTNVLIQGLALQALPWGELGRTRIEVVICGPVIRELDRLKNKPGRVGRAARAMSGTVRELMGSPERSDILRQRDPQVCRRLKRAGGSAVREGLDISHDDQAIIHQALSLLDEGADVLLLTDDNFAAMTAEDFGLPVMMLPAHWLKPAEGDGSAKEIARLQAENSRLKAAEPALQLRFVNAQGEPIARLEAAMKFYPPLADHDIERLTARALAAAPMADLSLESAAKRDPELPGGYLLGAKAAQANLMARVRPVTQADIDEYAQAYKAWAEAVRAKLAGFAGEWNRRRDWPRARLMAANGGTRPAEDVLIEIEAAGGFQISGYVEDDDDGEASSKPAMSLSLPAPPRGKHPLAEWLGRLGETQTPGFRRLSPLSAMNTRREDDAFYWREGRKTPGDTIARECRSKRHGRHDEAFNFRIWGRGEQNISGLVTGRVSASNLSQHLEVRLPVRIAVVEGDSLRLAEQLVEMFERHRLTAHR